MNLATAIKVALTVLGLVRDFLNWVERRQIADDATKAIAADLREQIDANIKAAEAARAAVRDRLEREPDSLRKPDEFIRPE